MPDDTVTTSWKRSTDEAPRSGCGADDLASRTRQKSRLADRNAEAFGQAAKLATWEDEGGTTVPVE
jgi:hypothetical protein